VEVVTHTDLDMLHVFRDGGTRMVRVDVPPRLNGFRVAQMNIPGELAVTAITRNDRTFIPVSGTEFREGDVIYLTVISSAMDRLEELLGMERI
jgi:trk system potassium uptake protein TrkA